jgi:hypothetical protein
MQQNCNVYKGLSICPTQFKKITCKHTKTIHKTKEKYLNMNEVDKQTKLTN